MNPSTVAVVAGLIENDLAKVADVVVEKGEDYVEKTLGVALKPGSELTREDVIRLREAAQKHDEFNAELDEKSRQRATEMQMQALRSEDPVVRQFIYKFAWFWSVTSVLYFFGITFFEVHQGGRDFANIILGFLLGTAVASILQFFYGSSKSSQDKTALLNKSRP
ncbi:MAG: hypothetical protein RL375_1801 [Pseudomonadota bacterium]|jgi:hypothetical protein